MVDNSCTCTHHRSKHYEATNGDVTVIAKCTEEKCTCQQFKQLKSTITPVQIKFTLIGTLVLVAIIISGTIGIEMVNGSVNESHERYLQIWKGDVEHFEENIIANYGENATLSDAREYLNRNANEFNDSKNASGVIVPVIMTFIISFFILAVMYSKERKEELLL